MNTRKIDIRFAALILLVLPFQLACGTKEHDPHEKIDAPGYYNGPMKPHGGNAAGSATGQDTKGG